MPIIYIRCRLVGGVPVYRGDDLGLLALTQLLDGRPLTDVVLVLDKDLHAEAVAANGVDGERLALSIHVQDDGRADAVW